MIYTMIPPEAFRTACKKCFRSKSLFMARIINPLVDAGDPNATDWKSRWIATNRNGPVYDRRRDSCGSDCFAIPTYIGDDGAE